MVTVAAGIVLIPGAPLGTITTAVQALAGVLLPSATVFLLLLCNDKAVLGPWTNPTWLNALASTIIGVLVILSAILTATTLFPNVNVAILTEVLFAALAIGLAATGIWVGRDRLRGRPPLDTPAGALRRPTEPDRVACEQWTMPPLVLIVKAVEVGLGH
jgi:uncharacterized membrane protein